jgi:alkanesulfonate monooxygenase SsuD/methylene tetrahydromethanopterin reductase-like flavin-dependent oxidoreductase (luciferase family)
MEVGYMIETSFAGAGSSRTQSPAELMSTLTDLVTEAREAEAAGFSALVVPERHMRVDCVVSDNLTFLTTLAAATETIFLGTYASVLTLHNPMQFAERVALIDLLSRGRVFVTLARGFQADYWRMMGMDPSRMTSRFLEGVDVVQQAWSGRRFDFAGECYSYDDVFLTPLPCQRPDGPPIWGGGHSARAIQRAAEYASAWAGGFFPINPPEWHKTTADYRAAAQVAGKSGHVVLVRLGFVAATRRRAKQVLGDLPMHEIAYYRHRRGIQPAYAVDMSDIVNMSSDLVIGSPDDCIEALHRYERDFGVDMVVMRFRTPNGPSIREAIEAIRLFGSQVLPYVHRSDAAGAPFLPQLSQTRPQGTNRESE